MVYTDLRKENAEKAARRRFEARELIRLMKDAPCVDCGSKYKHYQMDFVRKDGDAGVPISKLLLKSKARILDEIQKCDLVCALCGRTRTWRKQRKARMGPT